MNPTTSSANLLSGETSPYLLQHADNPVDWYPWGEAALDKARSEDKPILLSIGYSACHWCHVMAHESFEDPDVAGVMNRLFVNIKVDREERPDLDKIYQLAHQLLTRRPGGWPLTVFLDPHTHLPFFAGTYFPKIPRFNLPGFAHVLERVAEYYRQRPEDVQANQEALRGVLDGIGTEQAAAEAIDEATLMRAERALAANFDPVAGGFGEAPKFPHTSDLMFLQRRSGVSEAVSETNRRMVVKTLTEMALGGIFDQLGGGFFRYSVDARWDIPHFEKMLYDNGPLLALYAEMWQATGDPLFRRIAEETAEWALREMQAEAGGFFSSLDADSEGSEGKYYVWDRAEIAALLPPDEYRVFEAAFGLEETPNFEGQWHLHRSLAVPAIAESLGVTADRVEALLAQARQMLFARREERVRPGRDEKILVSWNALMIEGMAQAGRILERPDWVAAAYRAFEFLRRNCWRDGHLRAVWKDGKAPLNAYLDDYAMLIEAALALLQAEWRTDALEWALALAECLLSRFEDPEGGGFYFTSTDHEPLIHRPKPLMDESLPSGNGVAASALMRLGWLVGEVRYSAAAERALRAALPAIQRYPEAHGALLAAMQQWLHPPRLVVLRDQAGAIPTWRRALQDVPNGLVFGIPNDLTGLPGDLAARPAQEGPAAYVCAGRTCLPPVRTPEDLLELLAET